MLTLDIAVRRAGFTLDATLALGAPVEGLFGASGSGKTTLLHSIAGLVRPDAGRMTLNGDVLFDSATGRFVPPHRRHIGLVFQDAQLFPHLSAQHNLLYGYRRRAVPERRFRFDDVVALLELEPLLQRRPHQLSGGEKQRVALGRALLFSPQLLLLDEPLSALDQKLKQQILPFLRRIRDETRIPMVYVTHALDEVLYLTPTLTMMAGGRVLGHGHYLDVFAQTTDPALTQTLDFHNLWTVRLLEHQPEHGFSIALLGETPVVIPLAPAAAGKTLTVGVRAAQIALARDAIVGTTIQNQLRGRIMRLIPRRHGTLVEIDVGAPLVAEVSAKAVDSLELQEGKTVHCLIKTQAFEFPDA